MLSRVVDIGHGSRFSPRVSLEKRCPPAAETFLDGLRTYFHDDPLAADVRKIEQQYRLGHLRDVRQPIAAVILERYTSQLAMTEVRVLDHVIVAESIYSFVEAVLL